MEVLERLVTVLARLPGVGRRSAERMAMRLARDRDRLLRDLAGALQDVAGGVAVCGTCFSLTPAAENPCRLCADPTRDDTLLCVVGEPTDIAGIEASGGFHGRYHALNARLSPARGQGPEAMRAEALLARVRKGTVREVILALDTDVESDATAAYLTEALRSFPVRVTRIAFGIPAGSGVAYMDGLTLARAIRGRQPA